MQVVLNTAYGRLSPRLSLNLTVPLGGALDAAQDRSENLSALSSLPGQEPVDTLFFVQEMKGLCDLLAQRDLPPLR